MTVAESKIKKWGNSLGIIIPRKVAEQIDLKEGEEVSVDIIKKKRNDSFGIFKGAKPFHREEDIFER
ncbi:MAG TPA: AbrB/MazE/SpoVT family DNA-binding domain-containing protein [Candidatus Nanoarchaeia archaeon]|nr:AbrB/MazE/SpoVT family DNA-binding domain-containing protein [Candidatus Nanoarchaeia archaeon]